ncbi:MAG: ATP-dependent RecD-like DNA helicase [Candidatus Riflebacteria bacterium]|nr:ATP-dependent RecD-like DNA helicase [Candidatus Riflebacteria bacterium]
MDNETLTFTVERITFYNESNGYHVLKGVSSDHPLGVTVVGVFASIQPGEELRATGVWTYHPNFGKQFQCVSYTLLKPATLKGIEKYLGSGMIKGIGPVTAKNLVDKFGLETIDIIENNPEKLADCPGIGVAKADLISKGWFLQRSVQDIMIFLQTYGITPAYASKIFKHYGRDAVRAVSNNPYILAYEIPGMGFKKTDSIAKELGISGNDPMRLSAGILFILNTITKDGHLFLSEQELYKYAKEMLKIDQQALLMGSINNLLASKKIVKRQIKDDNYYYLPAVYKAEQESASIIKARLNVLKTFSREILVNVFSEIANNGICLTELQEYAIEMSFKTNILIITGGPGTGKTTTLKSLAQAHKSLGRSLLLASPTGRAAKRLSEVSGFNALTIHRLLDYSPKEMTFKNCKENPLDCDTLIIDEASMIDMNLFYALLSALKPSTTLILVGDSDQLPSVGPGSVLNELIKSDIITVVKLTSIFRQSESSDIIKNAHLINSGKMPKLLIPDGRVSTDCYFVAATDDFKTYSLLKNILTVGLTKKFGFDPVKDIQVITPMNKGSLGVAKLNEILRDLLNPSSSGKNEIQNFERNFREGDKVIQLRNNYDLDVYNGDMGIIKSIDTEEQEIVIDFSQKEVTLQSSDLVDLSLAYAITVHKSQGSEYPCVIMVVSNQHYLMLQRNLIYTGLTRARKTMVFLGTSRAISLAVNNDKIKKRNTVLAELLRGNFA